MYTGEVVTAVQSATAEPAFQLFPNPANGSVTVQLPAIALAAKGQVFDQLGRLVKSFSITATAGQPFDLEISDLKSGIYFVQMTGSGLCTEMKKLVVNRAY